MTFLRPHLRADQVQPGDRLLVADDLALDEPLPALPLVEGVWVGDDEVTIRVAGRNVLLRAGAGVIVERSAG
jgi:hypothetical protein